MSRSRRVVPRTVWFLVLAVIGGLASPISSAGAGSGSGSGAVARPRMNAAASSTAGLWHAVHSVGPTALARSRADVAPRHFLSFTLNRTGMLAALRGAPMQHMEAGAAPSTAQPLVLALPAPGGAFQRFAVQESPVMMPALARKHPHIQTYDGRGIDDPTANIRFAMTPLGFSASVMGRHGAWYLEPAHHLNQSVYISYFGRELPDHHGRFVEREAKSFVQGARALPAAQPAASVGPVLRTYRLALVSDPSYADYWGAANVTTGKVLLVNRIDQIYESELSIHLDLAVNNDRLNLNTPALATSPGGACGAAACFTQSQFDNCDSTPNGLVIGLNVGAGNYDIGHLIEGVPGGGISSLGIVGKSNKWDSCTGLEDPIGDEYVVGYVAHEMGHEFDADHTWNGTLGECSSDQRDQGDSVEPGSGSTIMAYAGICGNDNLQAESDPYFSQKSFDEITSYVTSSQSSNSETQMAALVGFDGTDSFTLNYAGSDSAVIARGVNYSSAGIKAAIEGIPGWPSGGVVTVSAFNSNSGAPNDNGFEVRFSGTLSNSANVGTLTFTNMTGGATGFIGATIKGGPATNQGFTVTPTGNSAPVVNAPGPFTIPYRTPFALTGSATDADNDTVTYLWEQNDPGGNTGAQLRSNNKSVGPLFRVFGTVPTGVYDPLSSPSGGTNAVTTNPTRVFPDMDQILANNTDAETATCATGPGAVDCWSEFLPTSIYAGPMHFRLTARDGHPGAGGVASADTTVNLAPGTGPFLVTAPNTAVGWDGGSTQTVTWNVAGTSAAPINTSNVDILMSTDGGQTFPYTLASSVPNNGTASVTVPNAGTSHARIEVRAVGNIFFDVSNADFTVTPHTLEQTISFNAIADRTWLDGGFQASATASSGLPVTFTGSGNCSVTPGGLVHIVQAGTCTVVAHQGGDSFYLAAPDVSRTFAITQSAQIISFPAIPDHLIGDPNFSVSATASSDLLVLFTGAGQCTVAADGSSVHLTSVGTCTITAHQSGNIDFLAAPNVARTFAINPVPVATTTTVKVKPAKVKHGKNMKITVTVKAPKNSPKPTGTVTIQIDGQTVGSGTLTPKGTFVLTIAATQSVGTHVATASYAGSLRDNASGSAPKNFKVT